MDAYQRVKQNRGAAGVDGESLAAFEKDLKGNLYKIWNRMSSGSYIPPPVKLVEIPKDDGRIRPLGVPSGSLGGSRCGCSRARCRARCGMPSGSPAASPVLACGSAGDGRRHGL